MKYLPQDHLEKVCNELVGLGEEGFERELKSVIFSHVPEVRRLRHATLDELVRFGAGEKQKRIDSLLKQLQEASRSRGVLESQADPAAKRELLEKIKRRELELEAHDKMKPEEKENPDESVSAPNSALLEDLGLADADKTSISDSIIHTNDNLGAAERRSAVANRLLEKTANFKKEFEVFKASLEEDANELGLTPDDLVSLSINDERTKKISDEATTMITTLNQSLDSDDPPGLRKRLAEVEAKIHELQSKLDAPNRAYQTYLSNLAKWQDRRAKIEGSDNDSESLNGLKATSGSARSVSGEDR